MVSFNGEPAPVELFLTRGVEVAGLIELPAGSEPPGFLWVEFQNQDQKGSRSGGRVDRDSLKFKVDGLRPGLHEVQVRSRESYEPIEINVPEGGLDGVVLRLQPKVEQPSGVVKPGGGPR